MALLSLSGTNHRFATLICKISPNWDVQMTVPEGSKRRKMASSRAGSMFFRPFGIRDDVFLAIVSGRLSFDAKNGILDEPFLGFPDGDPGKPSPEWVRHLVGADGIGFEGPF
jgi:hypothetical protein